MAEEMLFNTESNGRGATSFSSLNRGLPVTRSIVPAISTEPMGGERTISPRPGIGLTRGDQLRTLAAPRTITGGRSPILRPVPNQPIFEPTLEPRGLGGAFRAPLTGRDAGGRSIAFPSSGIPGAGENPGTNQPKTPFDEQLETLFRGYFGEPIKGSADKAGEFVYFPPSSSGGGMSGGMILLLVAGVGVAGYYAYKKFGKGE